MAGAMLAGCVKNESVITGDGSSERIAFDAPVVTIPTKATEIVSNYPKDKDFGVFAIKTADEIGVPNSAADATGTAYMDNVRCVANSTETPEYWKPEDRVYYWPKTGYLTFGAYAPHATNTTTAPATEWNAFSGFEFNDFTVNATSADQYDLLYSDPAYDKTKTSVVTDDPYDGVTLVFNHALSSIVFTVSAQPTGNDDKIYITNITVKNVYEKGDFNQNYYVDGGQKGTAAWTVKGGLVNYTVFSGEKLLGTAEEPINGSLENDATADTPDTDGKRRSDLILMPQNLAKGEGRASDATVEITYEIKNKDGIKTAEETVPFNLAVKNGGSRSYAWEMGKRYIYHISIGLEQIYFNPTVTPWEEVEGEVTVDTSDVVSEI